MAVILLHDKNGWIRANSQQTTNSSKNEIGDLKTWSIDGYPLKA